MISSLIEHSYRPQGLAAPVVESTGTGGGFKRFCAGLGLATPDMVMASRPIKDTERQTCARNAVTEITETRLGHDGIVLANTRHAQHFRLTADTIRTALARDLPARDGSSRFIPNPYRYWHEIDAQLPSIRIRVLGPPPTSGTRDILVERLMHHACLTDPALSQLHGSEPDAFARLCYALREDGAYVEVGENDDRLVRKLLDDPSALGLVGYNSLDRNRDRLQAATIDGVDPDRTTIETGAYRLGRPLLLYAKMQHTRLVAGLPAFIAALHAEQATGEQGYLLEQGLIRRPGPE